MADDIGLLREELRRLCKGRGVLGADLGDRIGPALRGALAADGVDAAGRAAVTGWLEGRLGTLPEDLELVMRAALGLAPQARQRFLGDRLRWLAGSLQRDERTVRRRVDEALWLLAEDLSAHRRAPLPEPADGDGGWYSEAVRAAVRLDLAVPEILEERVVAVTAPLLRTLVIAVSVPTGGDLRAEVVFGGLLRERERPSRSHFRFVIDLPAPLRAGDRHDLALRYWFPDGRMAPHYALTPFARCDELRLRVRFPRDRPGTRAWRLDGLPVRVLDDPPDRLPPAPLNAAGEAHATYTGLALGHAYGLRWRLL